VKFVTPCARRPRPCSRDIEPRKKIPLRIACWSALSLLLAVPRGPASSGPYDGTTFKGSIAWSGDGNHNDPDDWIASPVALAIFAEAAVKHRLVQFDYNSILSSTDPEWEKTHAESVSANVVNSMIWDDLRSMDESRAEVRGLPRPDSGPVEVYSPFSTNLVARAGGGQELLMATRRIPARNTYHPRSTSRFNPQMGAWYGAGAAIIRPKRNSSR
jgi:hypothetical protein